MPEIALVTDSSACIPPDLSQRYGIIIVPLAFLFDDTLYYDGSISSREFYERLEAARRVTTTSPAPGEFLEAFRRAREAGAHTILCLNLSAQYSGTYSSAVNARELAAAELPAIQIEVLDTRGIAMVHGFAVLAAARAVEAGGGPDEALAAAKAVSASAHLVGALDTMRYLAKSGRVPWIVHWAASALQIKPVLAASGDRIYPVSRARTMPAAVERMMEYLAENVDSSLPLHAAVMHANAPDRAGEIAERVARSLSPEELLVTEFTSVTGIHTGPGFVGLAFYPGLPAPAPKKGGRGSLTERDADRLEQALGDLPEPVDAPALVVLTGLPGAGKSHFRRELAGRYPTASLESDALRRVLFPRPQYTDRENARLFPAMHRLLERLLARGVPVVFDATNLREAYRRPLYRIAKRHGARLVVARLTAPEHVVQRRLETRALGLDARDVSEAGPQVYEKMKGEAEPVSHPHLVIDTSGDITPAVVEIVRQLKGG